MDVALVMDEIGQALAPIDGLRVYTAHPDSITPPAAIVGYPEIDYDQAYRGGQDRYDLPLFVAVAKVSERAALANVAPYLAGGGAWSVTAAIDTHAFTTADVVSARRSRPDVLTVGGVDYLAYVFDLDVVGPADTT